MFSKNRIASRSEVNPLDKCTIISIFPREVIEIKHTIQPGVFTIPAGSVEKPGVLVVGTSSWWRELDDTQPLLEIPISSIQIADSIVRDYVNSMLGVSENASPGIFYVTGSHNDVKKQFSKEIERAAVKQKNWYQNIVKIADILWSRSQGNPLAISDDARLAARELNLNDKEWLRDYQIIQKSNCQACGSLINPAYPVCPICRAIIDVKKAQDLGLKFASVG